MANSILNGDLGNILNFLSAAAGLGAAAMGLVDSTKVFGGGPSNFGFRYIENEIGQFLLANGAYSKAEMLVTLRANWLNGVPKADQKAKAKALIHLGLAPGSANQLAAASGVDPAKLASLATKVAGGVPPTQDELNVLGQFDVIVSAVLDAAYERGDQKYRNACKFLAMAVATVMAVIAGWLIYGKPAEGIWSYFLSWQFCVSAIIGLSATPLAPVAKDLASSLQAAAAVVSTVKR